MRKSKRLKIFIAGPYTVQSYKNAHDIPAVVQENVNKACGIALKLLKKGHCPYIPHLTHYLFVFHKEWSRLSHDKWLAFDEPWVEVCDALFYMGHSSGADKELKKAKTLGKKIFYSMDEVPEVKGI